MNQVLCLQIRENLSGVTLLAEDNRAEHPTIQLIIGMLWELIINILHIRSYLKSYHSFLLRLDSLVAAQEPRIILALLQLCCSFCRFSIFFFFCNSRLAFKQGVNPEQKKRKIEVRLFKYNLLVSSNLKEAKVTSVKTSTLFSAPVVFQGKYHRLKEIQVFDLVALILFNNLSTVSKNQYRFYTQTKY